MTITEELVRAFFEDRCSRAEAEVVYRYLTENPRVVLEYFPEEEWLAYLAKRGRVKRMMLYAAAAAMVLLASGLLFLKQPTARVLATQPVVDTVLTNETGKTKKERLTDGSIVELSPHSTLRLRWGFDTDRRSVILSGEALFTIAKDKQRPFTVLTKQFSTAVLGTVFRVKAGSVLLLSGKIFVRNLIHPDDGRILSPGQECTFDYARSRISIAPRARRPAAPPAPDVTQLTDGSSEVTDKELLFRNLPLPRVFNILSDIYHVPIQYTNLSNRNFTGSFKKDQSIEEALNTIAQLNDLLIDRKDSSYRITIHR